MTVEVEAEEKAEVEIGGLVSVSMSSTDWGSCECSDDIEGDEGDEDDEDKEDDNDKDDNDEDKGDDRGGDKATF